jgi:crossover junction endodeoxyribonuclease RusA
MHPPHKPKQLRIALPWPNKVLSPNARPHWAAKGKAVKKARNDANLAAIAAMRAVNWMTVEGAMVSTTFHCRDARRRDRDNFGAMCKSYFDGFADAGVITNDAGFHHAPIAFVKGVEKFVLFVIEEVK